MEFGATDILGTTIGAGQLLAGIAKNRAANKIDIPEVDPQVQSLADNILARSRSSNTGSVVANRRDNLAELNAGLAKGIVQASGGAGGVAVTSLIKSAEATGQGFNDVLDAAFQQEQFFTGLASDLVREIAQRRLEVKNFKRAEKRAQGMQLVSDGLTNIGGGLVSGIESGTPVKEGGGSGGEETDIFGSLMGNVMTLLGAPMPT